MKMKEQTNYNFLAIITLFFMLGMIGTRVLVPIYSIELHATPFTIGIIIAMFPILPLLCSIQIGKFIEKTGCKRPIIVGSLIGSISLMVPFVYPTLTGLIISQIFGGVCNTIFVIAAQSFIGKTTNSIKRDVYVMRFSLGSAFGAFLGPLIGGISADLWGSAQSFFILGAICIVSSLMAMFLVENQEEDTIEQKEEKQIMNTFQLLKSSNLKRAILVSIIIIMGKDTFTSFFPLIAVEMGLTSSIIGIIISINTLAGIIIRWFIPVLLRHFSRNGIILTAIILCGLLMAVIPIMGQVFSLAVISFLLGIGLGVGQPLSISTTLYVLPKTEVSHGLGIRIMANRFIQLTLPLFFGLVAQLFSLAIIFYITGILSLLGAMKSNIKLEK